MRIMRRLKGSVMAGLLALAGASFGWAASGARATVPAPVTPTAAVPLPDLALGREVLDRVTRIEISQPDPIDEEGRERAILLEKGADGWEITRPIHTRASAAKVNDLLDNLAAIAVRASIEPGTRGYENEHLTATQGVHVVAWSPDAKVRDLYFGRSDERGQILRIGDTEGVWSVANSGPRGYSGFLYTRSLRSWREPALLDFDGRDAVAIEITNANGEWELTREKDAWSGSFRARSRGRGGALRDPGAIEVDGTKVDALLAVYRKLAADDFGDESRRPASGVDDAEHVGGVVRIRCADGSEHAIRVGNLSTNTGRWAIPGSRWAILEGGDGTLVALAPWTADWALADPTTFAATTPARGDSKGTP
jgi:Domain of unknown function (DUF4340)